MIPEIPFCILRNYVKSCVNLRIMS